MLGAVQNTTVLDLDINEYKFQIEIDMNIKNIRNIVSRMLRCSVYRYIHI